MKNTNSYLEGHILYGDDFDALQVAGWCEDEREGYASLGAADAEAYNYQYHAMNIFHGYRHLPAIQFDQVLGFGSAYGHEFLPIAARVGALTIVDPSDAFTTSEVYGIPVTYLKPTLDGALHLPDGAFDLTTCLGVLHHIPNVSFVLGELVRTMRPGGYMLLREPIVSMGDWRKPRKGLTKHERGIPRGVLLDMVSTLGLEVVRESLCGFPLTTRLFRSCVSGTYNSAIATRIDAMLCALFAWNVNYHPRSTLQRLRPTSVFLILRKSLAQPAD